MAPEVVRCHYTEPWHKGLLLRLPASLLIPLAHCYDYYYSYYHSCSLTISSCEAKRADVGFIYTYIGAWGCESEGHALKALHPRPCSGPCQDFRFGFSGLPWGSAALVRVCEGFRDCFTRLCMRSIRHNNPYTIPSRNPIVPSRP